MVAYEKAVRSVGVGALEVSVAGPRTGSISDCTTRRSIEHRWFPVASSFNTTWAQLTSKYQNKLNATDPAGGSLYARIDEIFAKFASNHVIFVDPKYIGDAGQRQDLIDQMLAAAPAEHWVLKGYYDNASLTTAARTAGIATWGLLLRPRTLPHSIRLRRTGTCSALTWQRPLSNGQWSRLGEAGHRVLHHGRGDPGGSNDEGC